MNLKKQYPSLYLFIKKGYVNKSYLVDKIYHSELTKKNRSALTQRLNNKLDGKSSMTEEELQLLISALSELSAELSPALSFVKKNIAHTNNKKNILDTITEKDIQKLSSEGFVISWFSCGATSAVATKLAIEKYPNTQIYYIDTGGEHPDNIRFLKDCEKWYNKKITVLKNKKYKDHFDVMEKTRYINGIAGARCTTELKKSVRFELEKKLSSWLFQVFGFDADEKDRAKRFREQYPEAKAIFPLIDKRLTKNNCIAILLKAGIELPEMYKLGYQNNNCIGCAKAGSKAYWLKIKEDFPKQFNRMAVLERKLDYSCIKGVYLDELKEGGRKMKPVSPECGLTCEVEFQ